MSSSEQQKTALVTGSSNGIGEAIVKELAKLNYKLIVTGRSASDVARVADECAKVSPTKEKPLEIVADLEFEQDVERLFEESMKHFHNKLNLLVNNAGFCIPVPHTQPEACYSAFKKILQINLNAAVKLTLMSASVLKETAAGLNENKTEATNNLTTTSIVNIGSVCSFRTGSSLAAYGTSKAALNMFSNSMAVELSPHIRVNCLSPGPIETRIIERSGFSMEAFCQAANLCCPLARTGMPIEVAHAVLYLADSEKAGFITGANLAIDGGILVAPMHFQ